MVAESYGLRQSNALGERDMTNIGGGEAEKHEGDLGLFSPAMSGDNRWDMAGWDYSLLKCHIHLDMYTNSMFAVLKGLYFLT